MTMSSEQLERQTEEKRAEVELTIDELRARLTPGQIVDEILSYARDGGRQFTSNLGRQVTDNPLPVVLMGAGLAWFMFGHSATSSRGSRPYYGADADWNRSKRRTGERLGEMASEAGEAMHGAADYARDTAEGAMSGMRHAAESAGSAVSDTARSLEEKASSAYSSASAKVSDAASRMKDKASELEQQALDSARGALEQVKSQPLMLIGLGLALGAAIGAAFPATEIENRVMGDTADDLKREAGRVAKDQAAKAKDAAQHYVEETVDEAIPAQTGGNGPERNDGSIRGHYG